nr:hypothetical protein [Tanacetum cinerariifolium]
MAFMTALSTSSTNDVNTANPAYEASTISPNVNTVSPQVSTANFNDNAVYDFMVENLNGFNFLQQDLEQIHEDDLEAIDLSWQLSLLSMRAKRHLETGTFTSIFKCPALKQLAIKRWDEYGLVIRMCLVGVTCESVRINL